MRIETPNLVVITDQPFAQARDTTEELNRALLALSAMMGAQHAQPLSRQMTAYVFNDGAKRFDDSPAAFALARSQELFELGGEKTAAIHALAHCVWSQWFPRAPRWLSEGMAQYLETFQWVDSTTVELGELNLDAYARYQQHRSVVIADLSNWDSRKLAHGDNEARYG